MISSTTQKQSCNLICQAAKVGDQLNHLDTLANFILLAIILGMALYSKIVEQKSLIENIKITLAKDKQISKLLDALREATAADRVVLALIHNTSIYAANYHMLKLSILHESLKKGMPTLKKIVRDVPLALITEELGSYNEQNELYATLASHNCKLKEACQLHLANINAHTICNFKLIYKQVPIGILSFHFNAESNVDSIACLYNRLEKRGIDLSIIKLKLINELI